MPDPETQQKPMDVVALELVLQGMTECYLDPSGEPRLRRKSDKPDDVPWPVRSRETEGWIAKIFFEATHTLLGRGQIDRVLLYLEGKAAEHTRVDMELCDAIESEPVLGLIIQLIKHERYLKTTTDALLRRLRELAKDRPYLMLAPRWPARTEALGRSLRRLGPWFSKAEIKITFTRDGRHRWIELTDSFGRHNGEPSPQPSQANPTPQQNLCHSDGSDGEVDTAKVEFAQIMK